MGYKIRSNTLYVDGTVDGKRYRLSTGKEATPMNIKWISKNHRDVLLKLIDKEKPKKSKMLVEYGLDSLETNAYSRKTSTNKGYMSLFNKHIVPYFKHYELNEIRPSDIKRWQGKLLEGIEPKTVKNARIVLSTILNDAVEDELIAKNPTDKVKLPKALVKDDIVPFTLTEVKAMLSSSDAWMESFLTTAFFTGMRTGELMALKWEDINFVSNKIHVRRSIRQGIEGTTKNGKDRLIDMLPVVASALKKKYRENGLKYDYIFTSRLGKPYTESNSIIRWKWKPLLKRCSIDYRKLYNTRHTFATTMLLNGEDVLWVSKTLGHADISTTMKYYVKYIEDKSQKRAKFLNGFLGENGTKLAQSNNAKASTA